LLTKAKLKEKGSEICFIQTFIPGLQAPFDFEKDGTYAAIDGTINSTLFCNGWAILVKLPSSYLFYLWF
jgi:hypothetical protein